MSLSCVVLVIHFHNRVVPTTHVVWEIKNVILCELYGVWGVGCTEGWPRIRTNVHKQERERDAGRERGKQIGGIKKSESPKAEISM